MFRHVLYFDTLDKTGIETLLVEEDVIKRDRESVMYFDKLLYEDNEAHFSCLVVLEKGKHIDDYSDLFI